MNKSNFSDAFQRDAVRQSAQRGCSVFEISQPLGVSLHFFHQWKKTFSLTPGNQGEDLPEQIRHLKKNCRV